MRKLVWCLVLICILLASLVGCGNKKEELNALDQVKKSGKLTIGLDDSYPPMEFRNSKNELAGFDIELGEEIAKKLGIKSEVVVTDFNGIILALNSQKFNMILSGMSITDKRKESIDFSNPYVMGGQVMAVRKGDSAIKNTESLNGKVIGCQLGTIGDNVASDMKQLKEVKKYNKITEAFQDLSSGRVDGVIMDAQVGGYYIAQKPGEYEVLDKMITEEPMGIGFKKGEKELREAVDKTIDELKKDGTLSKLSLKWFGFDVYNKK